MSERKVRRTIESFQGVGTVTHNGEDVATVRYEVDLTQEFTLIRSKGHSRQVPGVIDARGNLLHLSGQGLPFSHDVCTLVFQDGREMDFVVTQRSGSTYSIAKSGDFRDPYE